MERKTRLGTILLLFTVAALVVVALVRFPGHLTDVEWPPHAKAHLIGQIGTTVALAIASAAILVGPFRSGKRWAWWCLALVGLAVLGGYWVAREERGQFLTLHLGPRQLVLDRCKVKN